MKRGRGGLMQYEAMHRHTIGVTLLDTETRVIRKDEDARSIYYWSDGNGSCDCNRVGVFDDAVQEAMDAAQHARLPTLLPAHQVCFGSHRFVIVYVHGDCGGAAPAEVLAMMNEDYPPGLLADALAYYTVQCTRGGGQ